MARPKREADRASRRMYRSGGARLVGMVGGTLLGAYWLYVVILAIGEAMFLLAIIMVILVGPILIVAIRAALAGARPTPDGVFVRNIRRSMLIRWDDIDHFRVGALGLWPRIGIIERRNGKPVGMFGIAGPNPTIRPNNRAAETIIERFNDELCAHRAAACGA